MSSGDHHHLSLKPRRGDEADTGGHPNPKGHRSRKKKAGATRSWLVLDSAGRTQIVDAGKQAIRHRLGISARDLRILEPMLSYPTTVAVRERAIMVNLVHVKGIITAQDVWLLNFKDPAVVPFVRELKQRFLLYHQANSSKVHSSGGKDQTEEASQRMDRYSPKNVTYVQGFSEHRPDQSMTLPFEFVALEACLEAACSCLDEEAKALEQEAYPSLDRLASKISTLDLERVRHIKGRLVALTIRVQKVRGELEHLLEDDAEMAGMYLTSKLADQDEHEGDSSAPSFDGDGDDEVHDCETDDRIYSRDEEISRNDSHRSLCDAATTISCDSSRKSVDVAELEMLLDAYFVQIDGIVNKLFTLEEYVDDTEDYVNIMLDDKQNRLLQLGILLSTATLALTAFIVVVGILGMNVTVSLWHPPTPSIGNRNFLWTIGASSVGTIFLYVSAVAWYKHRHWLD